MNTKKMLARERQFVQTFIEQFEKEIARKQEELYRRSFLLHYIKTHESTISINDCNYIMSWLNHSTPDEKSAIQIIRDLEGE